jgi:hypothetical protein
LVDSQPRNTKGLAGKLLKGIEGIRMGFQKCCFKKLNLSVKELATTPGYHQESEKFMGNPIPKYLLARFAFPIWIFILAPAAIAQSSALKFDRDTVVEFEYQDSFCQGKSERAGICSDGFSISQSSAGRLEIDSIYYKVTTPGIQSSQAMLKYNQKTLYFAYSSSGSYPWKIPNYNDSGNAKISLDPLGKVNFGGTEIDDCLYLCPVAQSGPSQPKLRVTGIFVFVTSNHQRDTLTVIGLQNQDDPSSTSRRPNSKSNMIHKQKNEARRNTTGRLMGPSKVGVNCLP